MSNVASRNALSPHLLRDCFNKERKVSIPGICLLEVRVVALQGC